jgi:hypothetical protein
MMWIEPRLARPVIAAGERHRRRGEIREAVIANRAREVGVACLERPRHVAVLQLAQRRIVASEVQAIVAAGLAELDLKGAEADARLEPEHAEVRLEGILAADSLGIAGDTLRGGSDLNGALLRMEHTGVTRQHAGRQRTEDRAHGPICRP